MRRHMRRLAATGAAALVAASLLAPAGALAMSADEGAPPPPPPAAGTTAPSSPEPRVYVPIEAPRTQRAPVREPQVPPPSPAKRVVQASFATAASVPFVQVPGTAVPLWWLTLVLLAIPLARAWMRWTASMFLSPASPASPAPPQADAQPRR